MTYNVGLIGWGTVGGGVLDILSQEKHRIEQRCGQEVSIKTIVTRSPSRSRSQNAGSALVTDDINVILNDESIAAVILLVGGTDISKEFCIQCLEAGKHVITANKAIIAEYWDELFAIAQDNNVILAFEAAVAGSIPIIDSLRDGFVANRIDGVEGILNGTCNYILTMMEECNLSYDSALEKAKELGYAEADPTLDVNGMDTAHKTAILARLSFNTQISMDSMNIEGIESLSAGDIESAKRLGARIKLLGLAQRQENGISLSVEPTLVPITHQLASVRLNNNAILIDGHACGPSVLIGQGAGALPTASAVLSDTIDIITGARQQAGPRNCNVTFESLDIIEDNLNRAPFYIRFVVQDESGVLAKICSSFSNHSISIDSVNQSTGNDNGEATIEIVTHPCLRSSLSSVINELGSKPILDVVTMKYLL